MERETQVKMRGIKYIEYANALGQGEILSRDDFAELMGASYSTATYHLERAVMAGLLNKQYGFISHQPGWLYALPSTMPRLAGLE